MDDADAAPRARRGLGFFPDAVVIRSRSPPVREAVRTWDADRAGVGVSFPVPVAAREPWHALKQWHMNPSGHGGRSAPPVFVPAENTYDELGRSVADGYAVEVDAEAEEDDGEPDGKLSGGDVASWYRSLASSATSRAETPEAKPANTATGSTISRPPPDRRPNPESSRSATGSPAPTSTESTPAPAPVRVHRSEWFIRRALLSSSKTSPAAPTPPPRPSSIGGMLNITAAKPAPAPIPRYVLGRENAGYARLESLGWQGGGLGRPAGWTGDESGGDRRAVSAERSISEPPGGVSPDGVVDLTRSSDDEDDDDDDEDVRHGPGRTAPIATALKLDRLGLGRTQPHKRVTHTSAEIARAQRRARGGKGAPTKASGEPSKKAKVGRTR